MVQFGVRASTLVCALLASLLAGLSGSASAEGELSLSVPAPMALGTTTGGYLVGTEADFDRDSPTAQGLWAAAASGCGSTIVRTYSGENVRASAIVTRAVGCSRARSVIRAFYAQPIGSSGATEARGFGCSYQGTSRVTCRVRRGNGYSGSRTIRWRGKSVGYPHD